MPLFVYSVTYMISKRYQNDKKQYNIALILTYMMIENC